MKKHFLSLAAILLLAGCSVIGQEKPKDNQDKNKLKDYDEIVIKRKNSDADKKVTIEIKDDKVLVNGKPIEDYDDKDLSVRKRSPHHYDLTSPSSAFRDPGDSWHWERGDAFNGEEKAFLGVYTEGSSDGAKIVNISENSPAANAGLKKDDIITMVNDKKIFDHEELTKAITSLKPGDKATITYKRDGKENKTTVTLGKRPPVIGMGTAPRSFSIPPIPPVPPIPNFDENGRMFNAGNRPRLGIKAQDTEDGKGVKVLDVEDDSPADKAGIREDDLITSFEGREVNSVEELSKESRDAREKTTLKVQLKRNGKTQQIELKIPKKLKTANL